MRKNDMGRKKMWSEDMQARFPDGTFAQIDALLNEFESRTDFVRAAVQLELQRRRAGKKIRIETPRKKP
jgi:Arc/MetJ-type ribon-helix-helix transcriptional regulator